MEWNRRYFKPNKCTSDSAHEEYLRVRTTSCSKTFNIPKAKSSQVQVETLQIICQWKSCRIIHQMMMNSKKNVLLSVWLVLQPNFTAEYTTMLVNFALQQTSEALISELLFWFVLFWFGWVFFFSSLTWSMLNQVEGECAPESSLSGLDEWFIDLWSWDLRCWCLHLSCPIDNVGIQVLYRLCLSFLLLYLVVHWVHQLHFESYRHQTDMINLVHQYPWSHVGPINGKSVENTKRLLKCIPFLRMGYAVKFSRMRDEIGSEWIH